MKRYRPLGEITVKRTLLTIPAFTYASTWAGMSQLLAQYAINNTIPFSIKLPMASQDSFVLAVRWNISPYVYRYKLWDGGVLFFPVYAGERIGLNAYFEVWSVNTLFALQAADLTYEVSWLSQPTECPVCANNQAAQTLAADVPVVLPPYAYCNPFCTPLC